jgi:hypothetical protein
VLYDPNAPRSPMSPPPSRGVEQGVVVPSSSVPPSTSYPRPTRPSGGPAQPDSPY